MTHLFILVKYWMISTCLKTGFHYKILHQQAVQ